MVKYIPYLILFNIILVILIVGLHKIDRDATNQKISNFLIDQMGCSVIDHSTNMFHSSYIFQCSELKIIIN